MVGLSVDSRVVFSRKETCLGGIWGRCELRVVLVRMSEIELGRAWLTEGARDFCLGGL